MVSRRQMPTHTFTRDRRGQQVQDLRHTAVHAADLQQRQRDRDAPGPHQPADAEARAGHAVEPLEAGVSRGNGVAPQLRLDDRLDRAADQDDPQRGKADLRAQRRRRDQFAGSDDGGGEDHAGTDTPQRCGDRRRRRFDCVRREQVRIAGVPKRDRGEWNRAGTRPWGASR